MKVGYLGIGHNGEKFMIKKFPRNELMEQLSASSAKKMYVDNNQRNQHVGYVISGIWIEVYEVHTMSRD